MNCEMRLWFSVDSALFYLTTRAALYKIIYQAKLDSLFSRPLSHIRAESGCVFMEKVSQIKRMKIQELAKQAGVSKSTIHYYMEKQLLPSPVKLNRTSALYDESYIERIRLIRRLQKKAFLPLGRIKRLLDTVQDMEMLENVLHISSHYAGWLADASRGRPLCEADIAAEFGFFPETLERLEQLGVLHPEVKRGNRIYHPEDVEILRILLRMSELGFTPARGWPLEALCIYVEAAGHLAEREVEQLFQRMMDGLHPRDTQDLFGGMGEDLFLGLFLWMRRKAIRKAFAVRLKKIHPPEGARIKAGE
ncbi:MAG: MerR family transcriptional regulator [Candidatus Abyssobacteria bacterium SURF_5]|uniref:MerR family transcriptional regulator n=1 Tax=Abyssobacteria bacterium (strain SURF_5) TaxID=2093360 RepID=A0A3A4NQA8_ABYX5|nr:MAG: MerR family transcriptional regulator [Candidatus Abyssubacteria bacterium SURF_5]